MTTAEVRRALSGAERDLTAAQDRVDALERQLAEELAGEAHLYREDQVLALRAELETMCGRRSARQARVEALRAALPSPEAVAAAERQAGQLAARLRKGDAELAAARQAFFVALAAAGELADRVVALRARVDADASALADLAHEHALDLRPPPRADPGRRVRELARLTAAKLEAVAGAETVDGVLERELRAAQDYAVAEMAPASA